MQMAREPRDATTRLALDWIAVVRLDQMDRLAWHGRNDLAAHFPMDRSQLQGHAASDRSFSISATVCFILARYFSAASSVVSARLKKMMLTEPMTAPD